MRAAHITQHGEPNDAIEIVDIPLPEPGPDEVRIQVKACALNHLDIFGRIGHPEDEREFPKQTGADVAGVVDELGKNVTDWNAGDRVNLYPGRTCGTCEYCMNGEHTMCHEYEILGEYFPGGLAEYLVVPAWMLESLPENINFITGAAWPVTFTTAWRMIVTAGNLRPAESALILGASGGVGNAAIQIADRLGATLYATTSTEKKADQIAKWVNEERIINYTEVPFDERIDEITRGRGVDLVADHVGQETWQQSINSLAMGGRMVICGATSGPDPDIDIRSLYQNHRRLIGAPMGNRQDFRNVGSLIAANELEPQIDRELSLDNLSEGHRAIENRDVFGKIVIRP